MKQILSLSFSLLLITSIHAKENIPKLNTNSNSQNSERAGDCNPASAEFDLAINNVRAKLLNGGDMWWDLIGAAKYEIPVGSGKQSLFASSLWIGGIDAGGNLKVAAQTYRQTGNDFYPGPLGDDATTDVETCNEFDDMYHITKAEVEEFLITGEPTQNILDWPGDGPNGEMLAPYINADGFPGYSPWSGDYPAYDLSENPDCSGNNIYGDETIWWVFNDKGNIHSETGGEAIGLEIKAQAFGFATNDEINNMTFYKYQITNKSSFDLFDTYFGQWVDPDLGNANDDFVGCDVNRGLGYCYNGDAIDEGINGYGANPPAVGLDFFEGPYLDSDGIDNHISESLNGLGYGDGIIDNERLGMSKFVYYDNINNSPIGNPDLATHFYNYLKGVWIDGTSITYGGNGHLTGANCDFMFPGTSDPDGFGTGGTVQSAWDEASSGNSAADRRFIQSAGPFTLESGAVNYVTVGAVWARASSGGAEASINLLKLADDKAQRLFNNCFNILDGPNAPNASIVELENNLVLNLEETENIEVYSATAKDEEGNDINYNFQGYQIYQLENPTVSANELDDPDKARQIYQCDLEDEVAQLVNGYFDPQVSQYNYVEEVLGNNDGIVHSFPITTDEFALGDPKLVNHKPYYFMVISYASSIDNTFEPYLAGRKNIKTYTAIPHRSHQMNGGSDIQSVYGSGPKLTRIEGQGNGGRNLELTDETISDILSSGQVDNPEYKGGSGPVDIKVIDPLSVPLGDFTIKFDGVTDTSNWTIEAMLDDGTSEIVSSQNAITIDNEQMIPQWGMSISVKQVQEVEDAVLENKGLISSSLTYEDNRFAWLDFLGDAEGSSYQNWIRSGTDEGTNGQFADYSDLDNFQIFETVLDGKFSPYRMLSKEVYGPAWSKFQTLNDLDQLHSVDIVFSPDPKDWTRCPMVELSEEGLPNSNVDKLSMKNALSQPVPSGAMNHLANDETGFTYFPGYAINVETGERLFMIVGENSFIESDNGNDMKFNPTASIYNDLFEPKFGGMHFLYIMSSEYNAHIESGFSNQGVSDLGASLRNPTDVAKRKIFEKVSWVGCPLMVESQDWLATKATVKIRVNKPYKDGLNNYENVSSPENSNHPMYRFSSDDIYTDVENVTDAQDALEAINVVPNPYYGYSSYERSQVDNRIRITNLPEKCAISIFTINGTLIKKLEKDNGSASMDWDLKNTKGIPVASGLYIIHVEVEGVGEKVLKWFGVMRPIDLDTF